jgi:hypothetical protein
VPDPANLTRHAVTVPDAQVLAGTVLDDATTPADKVRIRLPDDPSGATDAMEWMPYTLASKGTWFPKRDCLAFIAYPDDGDVDPVIVWWKPAAGADPDEPAE